MSYALLRKPALTLDISFFFFFTIFCKILYVYIEMHALEQNQLV